MNVITLASDREPQRNPTPELDRGFHSVELEGIKLAAKGRLIAVATFAVYSVLALSGPLLHNTLAAACRQHDLDPGDYKP